jgi:hypothetical protein
MVLVFLFCFAILATLWPFSTIPDGVEVDIAESDFFAFSQITSWFCGVK